MTTWISDDRGNRCSVEHWGGEARAREALASNEDCSDCSDCSGCSRCSRCSRCSGCSDCSGCSRCSDCSGCSELTNAAPVEAHAASTHAGPPPVPVIENIHQRVHDAASAPDALNMRNWHSCERTHCRAGWVVALAGETGKALERFYDTPLAAMKIYDASSALEPISPVRFFEPNDVALADMKRMAEAEQAAHA